MDNNDKSNSQDPVLPAKPVEGLDHVVVATSTICFIDGEKGILRYRGYEVSDLAEHSTYEEVAFLLLYGHLPVRSELEAFKRELRKCRPVPKGCLNILSSLPSSMNAMGWLRTAVSALEAFDPEAEDLSVEANIRKTIRLTARMGTLTAAIDRVRKNLPVLEPLDELDHAGNLLYMLSGKKPDASSRRAMDIALILQADHELNASTFAGRVTISTLSDMYSGVTSAVGTLKGPLHGGANQRVMEMLESIGDVDRVEDYVKAQLSAKKRIPGFGHRVYKSLDPRAAVFKKLSKDLSQKVGPAKWYEMSDHMEKIMFREKHIIPNLDFYSASVFRYLGIDTDLFPLIFATSRVVGWCTHFIEQYHHNRLIRPVTEYAGHQDLQYVPMPRRRSPKA